MLIVKEAKMNLSSFQAGILFYALFVSRLWVVKYRAIKKENTLQNKRLKTKRDRNINSVRERVRDRVNPGEDASEREKKG